MAKACKQIKVIIVIGLFTIVIIPVIILIENPYSKTANIFLNSQNKNDFVKVVSVSQGSMTVINSQSYTAVIDFGIREYSAAACKALKKQGITTIDVAFITHHHADHMGGLEFVINNFNVKSIVIDNLITIDSNKQIMQEILNLAKSKGIKIITPAVGQVYRIGNAVISIIYKGEGSEQNSRSFFCRVLISGRSFLITGDALKQNELEAISKGILLKSDVLIIGHHGSNASSDIEFLQATSPTIAVISCGYDNMYAHPSTEVEQNLNKLNITYYRTDLDQSILFTFNNGNISVRKNA